MSPGTKGIPQIPWARDTEVLNALGTRLKTGSLRVEILGNGELLFRRNSKEFIEEHMERNEAFSAEVREWFEKECAAWRQLWRECIGEWIQGHKEPRGVKEWRPGIKHQGKSWKIGSQGHGNTFNHDQAYWWGDVFEYTHFEMPDKSEGLVVMWHLGGDVRGNYGYPEVWIGSVEEFMGGQYESDPKSADTFRHYNQIFENGILWAYDQRGLFEENSLPLRTREVIEQDPWLLWPDLVDRLIPIMDELDEEIQAALRAWIERRRMEAEKATGQRLLWPETSVTDQPGEGQPWAM
jgi:hypothetical protein